MHNNCKIVCPVHNLFIYNLRNLHENYKGYLLYLNIVKVGMYTRLPERRCSMAEQRKKIDVVSDFSYDSENRSWNRAYRQWRRTNRAKYMYHYQGNRNEISYVDGNAVSKPGARIVEQKALANCAEIIGLALLVNLITQLVCSTVFVGLLRLFGAEIRLDLLNMSVSGNRLAVTAVRMLIRLLKYCIPAAVLIRGCRIPRSVAAPVSFGGLPESILAVGAAMITAGIYALTAQDAGISTAQEIFTYNSKWTIMAYAVFDVFFVSVAAELLLRGTMLTLLRQYGDTFAIAASAVIAFLLPNTLSDRISELLIALISGYLFLRAGSLAKCILLRMVCSALCYARLILVYANRAIPIWQYAFLLIATGTVAAAFFVRIRKEKIRLRNRETELKDGSKMFIMSQTLTMLPWIGLSVLLLLFQIFL